jgi:hypothetical protein
MVSDLSLIVLSLVSQTLCPYNGYLRPGLPEGSGRRDSDGAGRLGAGDGRDSTLAGLLGAGVGRDSTRAGLAGAGDGLDSVMLWRLVRPRWLCAAASLPPRYPPKTPGDVRGGCTLSRAGEGVETLGVLVKDGVCGRCDVSRNGDVRRLASGAGVSRRPWSGVDTCGR